jgi:hypothetical protein
LAQLTSQLTPVDHQLVAAPWFQLFQYTCKGISRTDHFKPPDPKIIQMAEMGSISGHE